MEESYEELRENSAQEIRKLRREAKYATPIQLCSGDKGNSSLTS
jgi:hypothetical protein